MMALVMMVAPQVTSHARQGRSMRVKEMLALGKAGDQRAG